LELLACVNVPLKLVFGASVRADAGGGYTGSVDLVETGTASGSVIAIGIDVHVVTGRMRVVRFTVMVEVWTAPVSK